MPERDYIGTCGFCGEGGGWLGDQGDETSTWLHSAVRHGEPGNWTYERHPNADPDPMRGQRIRWCGQCVRGLIHKFQRYDDTNLRALVISSKVRLELDGPRWSLWDLDEVERAKIAPLYRDDMAIHRDKLILESDLRLAQEEEFRRYGHDLTAEGRHTQWRP